MQEFWKGFPLQVSNRYIRVVYMPDCFIRVSPISMFSSKLLMLQVLLLCEKLLLDYLKCVLITKPQVSISQVSSIICPHSPESLFLVNNSGPAAPTFSSAVKSFKCQN